MKKLFFVAALTLGSLTAFAQDAETTNIEASSEFSMQDNFTEIDSSALPEAISAAISRDYPTATLSKAFVNENKQYKLEVVLKDGAAGTLYADENGNWLEI